MSLSLAISPPGLLFRFRIRSARLSIHPGEEKDYNNSHSNIVVTPTEDQSAQQGHNTSGGGQEQSYSQSGIARVRFRDVAVERLHYPEVDGTAEARHRQLESEDHVQLLALEPQHRIAVLGHSQRLSPNAEHKSSHDHQPEVAQHSAGGEDELAHQHDQHVDDGAQADAEDPIDQEASHKAQHNVWP